MQFGKTCFSRHSSSWQLPRALTTLAHLGRPDSPIRQSSRLLQSQITFSCGSMPCFHFFLRRLRRHSFSSDRLSSLSDLFFCRFFPEKEKKAGSAALLRL